jgi:DnaJ-class molecular chaperone
MKKRKGYYIVPKQKELICSACNGSGKYDNTGSPKCGACNGTGKKI